MRTYRAFVSVGLSIPLLLLNATPARAERFEGRGVHYFEGAVRSPLAGIGSRADRASNRLALDDEKSTVEVDRDAHRIVLTNTHAYRSRQLVGDLLFLCSAETATAKQVACGVHLKIEKKGERFKTELHPHPTTREKIRSVTLEPFTVVLRNGKKDVTALTPEQAKKAILEPELTARLANIALQVTDHLEGKQIDPAKAGARLVDLSLGFGTKKLNLEVARIEVVSLDAANAQLVAQGALAEMLARGAWEFRINAVTPILKSEFERDLFLFGLDGVPLLEPLKRQGLRRGEALVVGLRDGKGYVRYAGRTAEIERPADVARAYLEFHFIGGLAARQVVELPARLGEAAAGGAAR